MLLFDCIRIHREAIITALSVISFIVLMVIGLKIAISKLVKICHDKYDHIIFWKWSSLLIPLAIVISLVVAFCISDWTKSDAIPGVKYCAGHNIDPTGNVLFYCPICKLLCLTSGRQKVVPGIKYCMGHEQTLKNFSGCHICGLPYLPSHYDWPTMEFLLLLSFVLFWIASARKTNIWIGFWCTLLQWIIVIGLVAGGFILATIFMNMGDRRGNKENK